MQYDFSYFYRMWDVIRPLKNLSVYLKSQKNIDIGTANGLLDDINNSREKRADEEKRQQRKKGKKEIELTVSEENIHLDFSLLDISVITLYENDKRVIKKRVGESYTNLLLKPIPDRYTIDDFISAYSLLKSSISTEIVKNIIQSSLTKEEIDNINFANVSKNLKIIFEIFDDKNNNTSKDKKVKNNLKISIDKALYERLGKKGILSKILTKSTCEVNSTTVKMIADELNSILSTKPLELKSGYIDSKRYEAELNELFENVNYAESSMNYYRDFPITENDLYYGRFKKVDDNSSESRSLALCYKKLKPLERKMIYNLIYELLYYDYNLLLNSRRKQFMHNMPDINKKEINSPLDYYMSYAGKLIFDNTKKANDLQSD